MNALEALCCVVACALLVPAWVALARQRDAWPYSYYPMFSGYLTPEKVVVLRIALERAGGERVWWRPRYAKLQEILGQEFQALVGSDLPPYGRRRWEADLVARVIHLIRHDRPAAGDLAAVCVLRRCVVTEPGGGFGVREELVRRYPLTSDL